MTEYEPPEWAYLLDCGHWNFVISISKVDGAPLLSRGDVVDCHQCDLPKGGNTIRLVQHVVYLIEAR